MHPHTPLLVEHLKFALCIVVALAALGALQLVLSAA